MQARNRTLLIALTQQGGNATLVGISGAFTLARPDQHRPRLIEDTATVTAGGDLVVDAHNDLLAVTVSAVMQKGGRVAVGVGIAINSFDTTTRAFIANVVGAGQRRRRRSPWRATYGAGALGADAVQRSASPAPSRAREKHVDSTKANPTATTNQQNQTGTAFGNGATDAVYGFGLSADVAVNFIKDTTEAFIDVPGTVVVGGDLDVTATTTSFVVAVAGAVIFNTASAALTLAGAFAWNELSGQTFNDPPTDGTGG